MKDVSIWEKAEGLLKLVVLGLFIVMLAKMGWGLIQEGRADPFPFHWLILTTMGLEVVVWQIGRNRRSDAS